MSPDRGDAGSLFDDAGAPKSPLNFARAEPYFRFPEKADFGLSGWSTISAFPNVTFRHPVALDEAPGTGLLFVAELEGRLYSIENSPTADEKRLVLDLSTVNQGSTDSGLLGMAFHPEFAAAGDNAGAVFLHYAFRADPLPWDEASQTTRTYSRLSRFVFDRKTGTIEPSSERVLIDQFDENLWHQGSSMFFHPRDGFLYLSVGDEGTTHCGYKNCQRVDRDLFGGVLRIDVDARGGDVSHPIVKQPESGKTEHYYIPNDNPFVGMDGALEEFFALGLRSPHRMSHDPTDSVTFIGDVGQELHEEINVLSKGANFQWDIREGLEFAKMGPMMDPAEPLGVWTPPLLALERKDARSVIGGYVYRGELLPELRGKYIFGDFVYGRVWALSYESAGNELSVVENSLLMQTPFQGIEDGITSFGTDARGELYLLHLGEGSTIQRLVQASGGEVPAENTVPKLLSKTGLFGSLEGLSPKAGLLPYSVNVPLYSDGVSKKRWASIPRGGAAAFERSKPWRFPEGSVFVKHFELALDEAKPAVRRRLETRVLVASPAGEYYGASYKWNADGKDAVLVTRGEVEELLVVDEEGERREIRHFFPGPNDCFQCHTEGAGRVLGVKTSQLNRKIKDSQGDRLSQLRLWQEVGFVSLPEGGSADWPQLQPLDASGQTAEVRVRSYLDANCSHCHGAQNGIKSEWDGRFSTKLSEQKIVGAELVSGGGETGSLVVAPGDPDLSLMFVRTATSDPNRRMPPLGRSTVDDAFLSVLAEWIHGLEDAP